MFRDTPPGFAPAYDASSLLAFCQENHPTLVAEELSRRGPEVTLELLGQLDLHRRTEVFSAFELDQQVELAEAMGRNQLAAIVTMMSHDERADLVADLSDDQREALWPALAQAERDDIRRLAAYPEGTAGAVMTSDYATLTPDLTVGQALDHLRREAPDRETIYYAYIIDEQRRLLGYVTLKDLILARPTQPLAAVMNRQVLSARVTDDQEEVARTIARYDLLCLPILNGGDALVGIVTHDDALDILQQEHTEDLERLMAIGGAHEVGGYLRTSAWRHFVNRCGWVVGLAALGLVSGIIIHSAEKTLEQLMILALYMPMVADTGGNTGSQSATVVIRALALGELRPRDFWRVLLKELGVSAALGVILGLLAFGKVLYLSHGIELPGGLTLPAVGGVIALALGLQVISATIIGAMLPLLATRLRLDPAVVASPALTTVVDITGLLIYFHTARWILGI